MLRFQQLRQAGARKVIEAGYFVGKFTGRKLALLPQLAQRMFRLHVRTGRRERRCRRQNMLALEVPRKFDSHIGSHHFVPIDGGR